MKIGLGFYPRIFTKDTLAFARQIGVSHIMVHIPSPEMLPSSKSGYWSLEDLTALVKEVERHGLHLEAIENFQPGHWHHILTDGPRKREQMENVKRTIGNMGKAGIPIMGYNFSLAAVAGRKMMPYARGGAMSPVYDISADELFEKPLPNGFVWGQQVEELEGDMGEVSIGEMLHRYDYFMREIIPVAEEAGVKMAIHPDDPPVPVMRQVHRLMVNVDRYDDGLNKYPSSSNMVEFCQGTFAEMPFGKDYVYDAIDHFLQLEKIAYVHFRNVRGQLPRYYEEFIDTGDVDMIRALKIYKKYDFQGMIIPDHVPEMNVAEPWTTGAAYTIGYIRALCRVLEIRMEDGKP